MSCAEAVRDADMLSLETVNWRLAVIGFVFVRIADNVSVVESLRNGPLRDSDNGSLMDVDSVEDSARVFVPGLSLIELLGDFVSLSVWSGDGVSEKDNGCVGETDPVKDGEVEPLIDNKCVAVVEMLADRDAESDSEVLDGIDREGVNLDFVTVSEDVFDVLGVSVNVNESEVVPDSVALLPSDAE